MEGVILFADDHIYSDGRPENYLFKILQNSLPTLGVHSLELAEKAIKSIGTFQALVLDWQYSDDDSFEDIAQELNEGKITLTTAQREDAAYKFLLNNDFYSLIYIFSEKDIEEQYGQLLRAKFGERIRIKRKDEEFTMENAERYKEEILNDIIEWQKNNKVLAVPIQWSQSINKSVQSIFHELSNADPNWIQELYRTAETDPVEPSVEVINLFQNLLAETIIQDKELNEKIKETSGDDELNDPENYAKVIRILYYGKVVENAPIMTGDIIKLDGDLYGIIITPECDIRHVINNPDSEYYELLCFSKTDYRKSDFNLKATIKAKPIIDKAEEQKNITFSKGEKTQLSRALNTQITHAEKILQITAFTQTNPRYHLLPCFEFAECDYSGIAKIDFRNGLKMHLGNIITIDKRIGKLNTPYIQELRQRYFSYKGRVGVPGHSLKLREWLLDKN